MRWVGAVVSFLIVVGVQLARVTQGQDAGVEAGFEDDVLIKGVQGTSADPDLKVYGYVGFGTNWSSAAMVTSGIGCAYFQRSVEIGSNLWIMGSMGVGITTAPSAGVHSSDSGLAVLAEVTSSETTNVVEALRVLHTTSAEANTNFGVSVRFAMKDPAGEKVLGSIIATRKNTDSDGGIEVTTSAGGTNAARITVAPGGIVSLPSQSAARAYRSSNQTIANSTWTKVLFDAESFDTQDEFDSTLGYRFVAKENGYYLVCASVQFAANANNYRSIAIYKNGVVWANGPLVINNGSATAVRLGMADIVPMNAGDYVEIWVWQNRGGTLNLNGGSATTYVSIHKTS